jgi:hypothetical protein
LFKQNNALNYFNMRAKVVDFLLRQKELLKTFQLGKNVTNSRIEINTYQFKSSSITLSGIENGISKAIDANINENHDFSYPIFIPAGIKKAKSCIILMHGLNERNWDKYLCWAEYLALNTKKPVILFPIAYHINRGPSEWSNPRIMKDLVDKRTKLTGNNRSLCFANAALSERLSEDPNRFFNSGYQTLLDMTNLVRQIKSGEHPLFEADTDIDLFGYSIGAFISEIILMANPENLFSKSRLFIFCGGTIFRSMYGESRFIMDKPAYDSIFKYYCYDWLDNIGQSVSKGEIAPDVFLSAFNSMIIPDRYKEEREEFFSSEKERISGISLVKDSVMPYSGVEACMGTKLAEQCFKVMDFPYEYTHESPFPANGRTDDAILSASFLSVFQQAASFLL